jgi:protein TIF31
LGLSILIEPNGLFAEEYATAEQAEAHVRRLLDILACTTAFAKPRDGAAKHKSSKHGRPATPPSPPAPASTGAHGVGGGEAAPPISEAHDMAAIQPPPKLGEFYDFFSFAHLTPPVHCEDPPYYADEVFRFRISWSVLS